MDRYMMGLTHRPLRYIYRRQYEDERERPSWQVRIPLDNAESQQRLFYDHLYGGKAQALAAAKAVRDRLAPKLPEGYLRRPHRHAVGVYFSVFARPGRGIRMGWVAYWQEYGRQRQKRFMIFAGRSNAQAKRLAKEWRRRMLNRSP